MERSAQRYGQWAVHLKVKTEIWVDTGSGVISKVVLNPREKIQLPKDQDDPGTTNVLEGKKEGLNQLEEKPGRI